MNELPFTVSHVGTPPIKCQGIKTKLVPFICSSIRWPGHEEGRWIEPFIGSGVVALNLAPARALLADTNRHIISFYQAIQRGEMNRMSAREFLECEGKKLSAGEADYYYEVRKRFNETHSSFDFLFLNRSCFNGVMRFNRHGGFNVPFGHKPQRFAPAYVTKIVNQIGWVAKQMQGKEWEFCVSHWKETLAQARPQDFVYLDPPYIGRHADYFNSWDLEEAERLADAAKSLSCGYALSMWLENRHRKNEHVAQCWSQGEVRVCSHFYHVGASEDLRNDMDEALVIKPGFAMPDIGRQRTRQEPKLDMQISLAVERRAVYQV